MAVMPTLDVLEFLCVFGLRKNGLLMVTIPVLFKNKKKNLFLFFFFWFFYLKKEIWVYQKISIIVLNGMKIIKKRRLKIS